MGKIEAHNREMIYTAEHRATEMRLWTSPLEEKMKFFLDSQNIRYEQQRIFYIYADDGWIIRYYIADFFIPDKSIIIEVDGKFHNKQKQHDKTRTRTIQEQYPDVTVLRYTWNDFTDSIKMNELLNIIM